MKFKTFKWDGFVDYPVGTHFYTMKSAIPLVVDVINKTYPNAKGFNFIVRGSSGSIIASAIIMLMNKQSTIIYVKKDGEIRHSSYNYSISSGVNIIVDDFISTGDTMREIKNYIDYRLLTINGIVLLGRCDSTVKNILRDIFGNVKLLTIIHNSDE